MQIINLKKKKQQQQKRVYTHRLLIIKPVR